MPLIFTERIKRNKIPETNLVYFQEIISMRLGFPVCIRCGGQVIGLQCLHCSQEYKCLHCSQEYKRENNGHHKGEKYWKWQKSKTIDKRGKRNA